MVVKDVTTSEWAALPSPGCHSDGLCPPTLDPLTIHPSSPLCTREVEQDVALGSVALEVEFWDNDLPIFEVSQVDARERCVAVKTRLYVFVPLATDVI